MKEKLLIAVLLFTVSCKNATEKWLDGLVKFKAVRSQTLSLEIMKMTSRPEDTAALTYQVRLYPGKEWTDHHTDAEKTRLSYSIDSCFVLGSASGTISAAFVQPVNNGIANCYEYLVSFPVTPAIKTKRISLVYLDRSIDHKQYQISLTK